MLLIFLLTSSYYGPSNWNQGAPSNLLFPAGNANGQTEFRVANIFSSHMVLQREPNIPSVWGYATPGSRVTIDITRANETEQVTENVLVGSDEVWRVNLGSWPAGGGYSLHVINIEKWISLTGPSGLTISFTGSMKPVSIESDRFMVCCLQTMEECDKVLYGRGWQGVTITGTEHLYSDILSL